MKRLMMVLFAVAFTSGMAFAQSNEATVDQVGVNLYAEIDQIGSGNDAGVQQGEIGSPISENTRFSGGWIRGAYVDQNGSDNTAEISISKSGVGALIHQLGNDNEAYQLIGNSMHKTTSWDRMGVHINQVGDNNYAHQQTVRSFGTHGSGGVIIDQNGSDNLASQHVIGGRGNTTEIFQDGNGNKFEDFTNADVADKLNLAWVNKPSGNFAQYQRGEYSTVSIDVDGSDNVTAQYQEGTTWGGGSNEATLLITGSSNEAAQAQLGVQNDAGITITGDYNSAGVQQAGNWHSASITQSGNSNTSLVTQSGL